MYSGRASALRTHARRTIRRVDRRLPIHAVSEEILGASARGENVVLAAETGSGKTTQVPQMLLSRAPGAGRIIVLQPRRLSARLVAQRVAAEMSSPIGEVVGFQTRHEQTISERNAIRFVTDGLVLRQALSNPLLTGVSTLIFDEFHERHLASDLLLAHAVRLRRTVRRDLKIIVMSATMDHASLSHWLECRAIVAEGRTHPVSVEYLASRPAGRESGQPWVLAARAAESLLTRGLDGSVLIFMPGVREIERTIERLRAMPSVRAGGHAVLPLHGQLAPAEQDRAVRDEPGARPGFIVATNVAETSITIPSVRHVIDSGLARIERYDARRELDLLLLEGISRASADQRAGRAGRVAPGTAHRLWTRSEHLARAEQTAPEIKRLDLGELLLMAAALDESSCGPLEWFEAPPDDSIGRARGTLVMLGALDPQGRATPLARELTRWPLPPRFARAMHEAVRRGASHRAAAWCAAAVERDLARDIPPAERAILSRDACGISSDLIVRERLIDADDALTGAESARRRIPPRALEEARRTTAQLRRIAAEGTGRRGSDPGRTEDLVLSFLAGFPDRVGVIGAAGACAVAGLKRIALDEGSAARRPGPVLALEALEVGAGTGGHAGGGEAFTALSLVTELDHEWLERAHPDRCRRDRRVEWSESARAVEEIERSWFGELELARTARPCTDPALAAPILLERIADGTIRLEGWNEAVTQWIRRARLVARAFPERELLAYDDEDLAVIRAEIVSGATRARQIEERDCLSAVQGALSHADHAFIERQAPTRLPLPREKVLRLEYEDDGRVVGRARIADLYDVSDTPCIAGGRVRVLLEILAPNQRPVQRTDDLKGFWTRAYPTLRAELKRRYPRHEWR